VQHLGDHWFSDFESSRQAVDRCTHEFMCGAFISEAHSQLDPQRERGGGGDRGKERGGERETDETGDDHEGMEGEGGGGGEERERVEARDRDDTNGGHGGLTSPTVTSVASASPLRPNTTLTRQQVFQSLPDSNHATGAPNPQPSTPNLLKYQTAIDSKRQTDKRRSSSPCSTRNPKPKP
jgi:hypothetical protein